MQHTITRNARTKYKCQTLLQHRKLHAGTDNFCILFNTRKNKCCSFYFIFNPLQCFGTQKLLRKINCLSSSTFRMKKEFQKRYIDFNISQFFETYFYEQTKKNYIYHVCNLARQQYFDDFSITANRFIFGGLFTVTYTIINHKNVQFNMHDTLSLSLSVK